MSKNARFTSVSAMIQETSEDADLAKNVERRISERQLVKHLIAHRVKNGMSQQDVAERLGCKQSRISKLESRSDGNIRLGDLEKYAEAIGLQFRMVLAPQEQTIVDEVKHHAFRIKCLFRQLVNMTKGDPEIADGISEFVCIEAPFNLHRLVVDEAKHIPQQVLQRLPGLERFPGCAIEGECLACEQEEDENRNSETEMQPS